MGCPCDLNRNNVAGSRDIVEEARENPGSTKDALVLEAQKILVDVDRIRECGTFLHSSIETVNISFAEDRPQRGRT